MRERLFHRLYEAPEEGGAAPEAEPEVQLSGEELIRNAVRDANATPEPAAGDAATDPSEGAGAGTETVQEDLILGRFKTTDDVIQAYQNLEPEYTQTRQQLKDLERQLGEMQQQSTEPEKPFLFESPFSDAPKNVAELEALAEQFPDRAAVWAIENSNNLPPELVQETINYWHQRNPAQATAYMLQSMMQSYMPQIEQQIRPVTTQHQESNVQKAISMAEAVIGPQYESYHERIIESIEANPSLMPSDVSNPDSMRDAIVNVYAMLLGRDMLQKGAELATGAGAAPAVPSPAQTVTRTAPAPPSGDADEDAIQKMIQDSILNAR